MIQPSDQLKAAILALPTGTDKLAALRNFAKVIGDFMSSVQGGPTGKPGILTFSQEAMVGVLSSQGPVTDQFWTDNMAKAWLAGVQNGKVTPGTVQNPIWTSSSSDIATIPSGAATVVTAQSASQILSAKLKLATQDNNPPVPMADAFVAAAKACTFLTIGLGPFGVPIPVPTPAK